MIKSVARAFRWTPNILNLYYLDAADIFGLWFWYQDAQDQVAEVEAEARKAKEENS